MGMQRISKRFRLSLTPFFGRFPWFLAPRRVPVVCMIGKAIEVPQKDNPTEEDVERLLVQYREVLRRLYNTGRKLHPDKAFWGSRELVFEGEPGHSISLTKKREQ